MCRRNQGCAGCADIVDEQNSFAVKIVGWGEGEYATCVVKSFLLRHGGLGGMRADCFQCVRDRYACFVADSGGYVVGLVVASARLL